MSEEPEEYEDDPIIAALGITQELRPVVPPTDQVFGYYQRVPPKFRLYNKSLTSYMEAPLGRVLLKGGASKGGSELRLRADGNYENDVTIGYTLLPGQEETRPMEPTHMALYATYAYPKTTPWHEW